MSGTSGDKRAIRLAVIGIRGFPDVQGGVEAHCCRLIPLLGADFDCRVYRRRPYLSETSRAAQYPGVDFVDLSSTRLPGFEALLHTLLCCLHLLVHRVDVVNIHNIGPGMFAPLLRLAGMRVVLTYHSPNYEHDKWSAPAKLLLRLSEKIALTFADHIIFVSPKQRARYSRRVLDKSTYVANGIPEPRPTQATDFLERHGIHPGRYVLAVGRLTPEKGFEYLVDAVGQRPEIEQLVIAGAGDHGHACEARLRALPGAAKTVFTGYTVGDDLVQLYSHAAVYALSSLNEGFPMVLLEAMSYGLPVVATDIPAAHIIELPEDRYVPRADAAALGRTLAETLNETQGETNPQRRVDYDLSAYNWPEIARRTAAIHTAAVRGK